MPTSGKSNRQGEYTWQEVSKHNTEPSAWVYMDHSVYDITPFLDRHPGGKDLLLLMAGRDITDVFKCYHPFTDKPQQFLQKFRIGALKGQSEFGTFAKDSGFYKTCQSKVKQYFTENNIDYKSCMPGIYRYIFILLGLLLPWCMAWSLSNFYYNNNDNKIKGDDDASFSCWILFAVRGLLMVISGCFQGLVLIHTMHDCSHGAITHQPWIWRTLGRFTLDVLCGCSFDAWLHQHVVGHHLYTNIVEIDPDCPMNKAGDMRRIMPHQTWAKQYRYQYIWLPVLYCIYAFKSRIQDITQTLLFEYNGAMRVNPHFSYNNTWSLVRQMLCKSLWVIRNVFVPMYVWQNALLTEVLPLWVIFELTTGYWLSFNFQVSHVSTLAQWPQPRLIPKHVSEDDADRDDPTKAVENGNENEKAMQLVYDEEWAQLQIATSVDYAHTSWIATFLSGALNYQSVHHLFPSVSQYHYPAIAPIVKQVCADYGVQFNHIDTFAEAFKMHIQQLFEMGRDPETIANKKEL